MVPTMYPPFGKYTPGWRSNPLGSSPRAKTQARPQYSPSSNSPQRVVPEQSPIHLLFQCHWYLFYFSTVPHPSLCLHSTYPVSLSLSCLPYLPPSAFLALGLGFASSSYISSVCLLSFLPFSLSRLLSFSTSLSDRQQPAGPSKPVSYSIPAWGEPAPHWRSLLCLRHFEEVHPSHTITVHPTRKACRRNLSSTCCLDCLVFLKNNNTDPDARGVHLNCKTTREPSLPVNKYLVNSVQKSRAEHR